MGNRKQITEQDDRFLKNKVKAEKDPAGMAALVIINLEDLADTADDLKASFAEHCSKPINRAHPPAVIPATAQAGGMGLTAGLSSSQRYKLAMMENRGKIAVGITAAVMAGLAILFHGVGY